MKYIGRDKCKHQRGKNKTKNKSKLIECAHCKANKSKSEEKKRSCFN